MKTANRIKSYYREFMFLAKGLLSTAHPVLAHVIPMRRCNLSCAYCNEYDTYSDPVALNIMHRRIDKLGELGTSAVIISGGEPLLHPDLERIVARIRKCGMMAAVISNCYLLTKDRIQSLNDAGLEYLQVSIDNVLPNEISKKSLKVLDKKLVWLSEMAEFKVNVNSVLGGGIQDPQDALAIGRRAVELGFSTSVGIIHDGQGLLKPLKPAEREVYFRMKRFGKYGYTRLNYFQDALVDGRPNRWNCRAGARYLYVCENGLVHYCSQQRGYPAIPLEEYSRDDIRREYLTRKACAPYCTIACVHQVATFDFWRDPQTLGARGTVPARPLGTVPGLYQIEQ